MTDYDERIRSQIRAQREWGQKGVLSENYAIAENVLLETIETGRVYGLTKEQSDRLLAHTRQDASHAVLNSSTAVQLLKSLKRWLIFIALMSLLCAIKLYL